MVNVSCGSRMGKALEMKREHGKHTYQGVLAVAAPATVKVKYHT